MTSSPTTPPHATGNEGWERYEPVGGSFVELLADGSFRLDEVETVFKPADSVSEKNATFSAEKEAGEGKPLYVTFHQGHTPLTVALKFESGEKHWYRRDEMRGVTPPLTHSAEVSAPTPNEKKPRLASALSRLDGDRFFKLAFFVFLGWYLFSYHGAFRGQSPDDEVLLEEPVPEVSALIAAPTTAPSTPTEPRKSGGNTVLDDGGYNNKPPGW